MLLVGRYLPVDPGRRAAALDRWGTPPLAVSLLALLIPLMQGHELGWPVWVLAAAGRVPLLSSGGARRWRRAAAALGAADAHHATGSDDRGAVLAGFGGFMFVYALMLQDGLHLGPFSSGMG
jgi:hypothetical protein